MGIQPNLFIFIAAFTVIALASKQIGQFFLRIHLPLISGFLFTGIIAGPFVLGLIELEVTQSLRFVDELSLAFIAFAAGSELYLKELHSRLRSIAWVTIGNVFAITALGAATVLLLSDSIGFMQEMPTSSRIAVALLAGAILVARSPSSAIAIINELRAKGPFTQTILGVIMISDVVVIILFALSSSVADALLSGFQVDLSFIVLLAGELLACLMFGYVLAKILQLVLALNARRAIKTLLILFMGYAVFFTCGFIRTYSHDNLPFEILLEPLLICMIASFLVTNYTNYRAEFLRILHDVGPAVYIAFFTLTGASLALDIILKSWAIALALIGVRLLGIFIGSFAGGVIAGDPMEHNRVSWMAYITQAGVGLGLAKEVVVEFPDWGLAFATFLISVIIINQIIGPPFFKWAINLIKESHQRAETPEFDGVRDAIIFGLESQSLALARMLKSHGWQVKVASKKPDYVQEIAGESEIEIHAVDALDLTALHQLNAERAEAIVMMLSDEENYQICELAYEHFGTENLVVRLHERANFARFHELGALIVDPDTAIVSLLDHFVRSPAATSLLLGMEENQDSVELELRNRDLHGIAIRDLRLPSDLHILSVRRRDERIVTHGYTRLEVGDLITVVGSIASLEHLSLRFDVDREHELLNLIARVTAKELSSRRFESEVKQIFREKESRLRDRFDRIVEQSQVLDITEAINLEQLFRTVADTLSPQLGIAPEAVLRLLQEREAQSSTVMGPGLAIPHIIIDGQHTFSLLLARSKIGIYFSAAAPRINAVFVLVGTRDERDFHLRALSAIAQIVQDPHFERKWLRARNERALRDVVLTGVRHRHIG